MLYFIYEVDSLIGFKYNDNIYYYIKNIQEDIIGILDSNYNVLVKYTYDSYGNILSVKDGSNNIITDINHIGHINPFRYRSYYYDKEVNLYYLNSRYYNPVWGRFINADSVLNMNKRNIIINSFCYCANDPINKVDKFGTSWRFIKGLFKKVGKAVSNFVNSVFGAKTTTSLEIKKEKEVLPDPLPLTIKSGVKSTTIISSSGNSTKPISAYSDNIFNNPVESSIGIKLNIGKLDIDVGLGLSNFGIGVNYNNSTSTSYFNIRINAMEFKAGFEFGNVYHSDDSNDITNYTSVDISGWAIIAGAIFAKTGQWISSPATSYGY